MTDATTTETFAFQTEARQLLRLMIHSLYSNKEIFLRELVSNGSDACDKLRFEALTDAGVWEDDPDLAIHVRFDQAARTITITDNGVGMSRDEVISQIGTIARSGTREFVEQLTGDQAKDAQLIGQFGVGFYSSFIVADRVTLTTRRAGRPADEAVRWESRGEGDYTLDTASKAARGTEVTLHLREGEDELLAGPRLRGILHKYSDHITIPIFMPTEPSPGPPPEKPETDDATAAAGDDALEQVNQASALWARPKAEITDEQYREFYKHIAHDFTDPLTQVHAKVEGRQEYTVLLYVPSRAPFDLWDREPRHGIKLYVRRVFIMDGAEQLMPRYLRFVRGVIDSNDLPLNISREILQQSREVEAIKNASVKRILGLLEDLARNDAEQYARFWDQFGRVIKEGVGEDAANKARVGTLLRFASTRTETGEQTVSFADYVARMKDGQDKIYYITADSLAAAQHSPHLEIFRKKGIEVLLLHDRVDEWLVAHLTEYDGTMLQSVTKGDLDLGDLARDEAAAEARKKTADDFKPLLGRIQQALGTKAKEVRLTDRLTESPACLVTEQDGMSANLERVLRAAGQQVPDVPLVLEINPTHPIVTRLKDETDDALFADWSHILFDQALLAEGGHLADPASFVKRLNELMLTMAGGPKSTIWTPGS